uniref:Uncharacterized protein n=1 Tax=Chenopodium quinoa TaxID=63459 RepID=A0A803MRW0_CHEQI
MKFYLSMEGKECKAINGSWKAHKCFTKNNYFSAYPTDALRWFHKLDTISEPQFRELLQYWHSKEAEQQQDLDKQEPSQARVYKESRKRTVGRKYLTNHEKIEENIAKMDALESSQHEDGSNSKDPYSEVIPDPKRKICVRLQGKGVKKSDLKKKDKKLDIIFPAEFLESMQSQLVQQLAPSVTIAILTQLRDANPEINLVIPDFAIPSAPKDASSAPHLLVDQNGQSSKSGATFNQLCVEGRLGVKLIQEMFFYLHSRLLERAAKSRADTQSGGLNQN